MADAEKEVAEGTAAPRGADWEVVTLTASAYAAAPGPEVPRGGGGSSDPLLMSDHFVFPPSEHENLPIQTSFEELQPEEDDARQEASTSVEDYGFKSAGARSGGPTSERIEFYDEGRNLSVDDDDAEMSYDSPVYGSARAGDDGRGFAAQDEGDEAGGDSGEDLGQPAKPAGGKCGDAGASCKCWLKKHMTCLYHQAKETNAIWSVVVAAALVGIVILGRWHKDKLHINPLKWCSRSSVRG